MNTKELKRLLKGNAVEAKAYYDENFPLNNDSIIDNRDFILKSFVELTTNSPYLLVGNEEKLVDFVSDVAQYVIDFTVLARGGNRDSVYAVIGLLGVLPISEYFLQNASDEKDVYLAEKLNPVIKLALQGHLRHEELVKFFETILPSWSKSYPRTMRMIYSNLYIVNTLSAKRNVPEKRAEWEELYKKFVPVEWQH